MFSNDSPADDPIAARFRNPSVAGKAHTSAHETVGQLLAATDQINQVVGLITAIAEQTSLLALSATIEAARGNSDLSRTIVDLSNGATITRAEARTVLDAVTSLKASSVDLGHKVERFLAEIDAA